MKCFIFFSLIILSNLVWSFNIKYFSLTVVSSAFECPSSNCSCSRNKCYVTESSRSYTFQENVRFCESLNSTTVSIHSEEENNFITAKFNDYPHWLGIRQVDFDAKTYAWLDGSDYNYSNWIRGDRKNSCAGAIIRDTFWFDIFNCDMPSAAFCQFYFDSPLDNMQSQIKQLRQDLKDDRKTEESRFNETNARLDKAMNTTNACITNLNSTFEAKLNEKDNRMDNSNQELARLHLVNTRLAEALNTQNDLIANMTSDLRNKEIRLNITEHESARHSLIITRLENAIFKQNGLIQRRNHTSEPKSTKN